MSKRTRNQPSNARREIVTPDGLITVPPGSPKIVIHTRQGKCVGIYCDQPAKVLVVETHDDPRRTVQPSYTAMLAMLGALKADVDRLGTIVGYGLGDAVSFGRFASVARTLDQFFKGFLETQIQRCYRHVYTVFAGGDDLFLIGPWYDLARLLADLHGWFRRLTCGNTNVTFSAGLVFSKPTTPVRHLAWLAEAALEQAKEAGRDRVTFASTCITWPHYQQALDLHRLMRTAAQENGGGSRPLLPRAMIYRFLQYANMALRSSDTGPVCLSDLKWRAQLSYDLKRNLPAPDGANAPLARLQRALTEIRSADEAAVLRVAATLTLYSVRGAKS